MQLMFIIPTTTDILTLATKKNIRVFINDEEEEKKKERYSVNATIVLSLSRN